MDVAADVVHDSAPKMEAAATPPRVLVTNNYPKSSEVVAINIGTKAVDGRLPFSGDLGTTYAQNASTLFLLEEAESVVARLDPVLPWNIDSSWNVQLKETIDGSSLLPYSDPYAVVVGAGGLAYVLPYNRNEIGILQTSQEVDAGPPMGVIDLSGLLQANDPDGTVEITEGVYVASTKMLFVVLENIDRRAVSKNGYYLYCSGTVSTVVGIDTATNSIVNLGGGGPGGSIALQGFNPVPGGLVYDAAGDGRLLLLEEGCYKSPAMDGGAAGARSKGGVEAVSLNTYATTILLNFSDTFKPPSGYPSGFVYEGPTEAVLGFDFEGSETYRWNPKTTTLDLAMKVPNAPDLFTYDGQGNLLGTVTTYGDSGTSSTSVVSVAIATGNSTPLAMNPFSTAGGYVGGVDIWPHP
jgi:hypothetical protein